MAADANPPPDQIIALDTAVAPGDTAPVPDGATVDEAGHCPPSAPAPGSACVVGTPPCSYLGSPLCSTLCMCVLPTGSGTATWSCGTVCQGPLPPPELA